MLVSQREMRSDFERLVPAGADPRLAGNWLRGEVSAALNKAEIEIADAPVSATVLAGMLKRIADGTISGKLAKEVFDAMWAKPVDMGDPAVAGAVLSAAGFDPTELFALADNPAAKERLKAATEAAVARGVFGAPTFFVGDALFFGQDRPAWIGAAVTC